MNRTNRTTAAALANLENDGLSLVGPDELERVDGGTLGQVVGVVGITVGNTGGGTSADGNYCGTPVHPGLGGPHTRS